METLFLFAIILVLTCVSFTFAYRITNHDNFFWLSIISGCLGLILSIFGCLVSTGHIVL